MFTAQTIRARREARKAVLACAPCLILGTESGFANDAVTVVNGTAVCGDHIVADDTVKVFE